MKEATAWAIIASTFCICLCICIGFLIEKQYDFYQNAFENGYVEQAVVSNNGQTFTIWIKENQYQPKIINFNGT